MSKTLLNSLYQSSKERPVHPECWALSKEKWNYFFTIHPLERRPLAWKDSGRGDWERKHFIYRFINFLQAKLRIKKRDYFWVATVEEEGKGKIPHLHFIFRLNEDEFAKRKKVAPRESQIVEAFKFCTKEMKNEFGPLDARIDLIGNTKKDRENVSSYFCKQDGFRKEKDFLFPIKKEKRNART